MCSAALKSSCSLAPSDFNLRTNQIIFHALLIMCSVFNMVRRSDVNWYPNNFISSTTSRWLPGVKHNSWLKSCLIVRLKIMAFLLCWFAQCAIVLKPYQLTKKYDLDICKSTFNILVEIYLYLERYIALQKKNCLVYLKSFSQMDISNNFLLLSSYETD